MSYDGRPGNVTRRIRSVIRRAHKHGLTVTATTNGTHASGSWHYVIRGRNTKGHAVDLAGPRNRMEAFQRSEYARAKRYRFRTYKEIIGPLNGLIVLQGRPTGLVEGTALEQAHDTHVHVAR
jgi:hypothetical protein